MAPSSNNRAAADPLTVLLQLESSLFKTESVSELAFLLVNQLKSLIAYDQASFWSIQSGRTKIVQATAVSAPDPHAPYLQWLRKVTHYLFQQGDRSNASVVSAEDIPHRLSKDWDENVKGYALLLQLKDQKNRVMGGVWLVREAPWGEQEKMVLARFSEACAIALSNHRYRSRWRTRLNGWLFSKVWQKLMVVTALLLLFTVPIHYSALAPAEIVASEPVTITAPMDGIVKEVVVKPNQLVQQSALLYYLDERPLTNQLAIEQEGVEIAEAELLNASQKVFGGALGEDLEPLRSKIRQNRARVEWIEQQLQQTRVTAPISGVVIDAETQSWTGRPVRTGEKILTMADANHIEVEMWLPVEDLQPLLPTKEIDLFLFSRGNQRVGAQFQRIAYQAELSPQGVMAYRVIASIALAANSEVEQPFRIGERGTAKLYGPETMLFFYLFRKPILWFRQWIA